MRCSSYRPLLDEYVDGTLSAHKHALVERHLSECALCHSLFEEFRMIDALLVTPRRVEPAPNFTFKVMAEVRSLPQPQRHRGAHAAAVVGAYLAFAWTLIGAFFLFGDGTAHAAWATLLASAGHAGEALNLLAVATSRFFGPNTFRVTAAMSAVLSVDVALALIVGTAVYLRRERAAARVKIS